MEVFDRDRVAAGVQEYSAARALQSFADWTGREGVCVPRSDLVETLPPGLAGLYRGPGEPIEVLADSSQIQETVLHELGHAIDRQESHVERFPELFPPSPRDPVDYVSDLALRQETFADTVSMGARDLDIRQLVADECGLPSSWTDAEVYVQAEIFSAKEPSPAFGGRIGLSRVVGPEISGLVSIRNLHMSTYDGELLVLVDSPPWVRWRAGWSSGPFSRYQRWAVNRVDPSTGAVVGRIDLPGQAGHQGNQPLAWFATTEGLPVVVVSSDETHMYEIDPVAGTVTEMPSIHLPPYRSTPVALVDQDGERWAFFETSWEKVPTLHAVGLSSGERLDLGLSQEDWGKTVYVTAMWPVDGRLLMVSYHEGISWYDLDAREWDTTPVPTWWGLYDPQRIGAHHLLFHTSFAVDTDLEYAKPAVIYDLDDGSWAMADDLCGTRYDDFDEYGSTSMDGTVWVLASFTGDTGESTLRLVQFELDDTPR